MLDKIFQLLGIENLMIFLLNKQELDELYLSEEILQIDGLKFHPIIV